MSDKADCLSKRPARSVRRNWAKAAIVALVMIGLQAEPALAQIDSLAAGVFGAAIGAMAGAGRGHYYAPRGGGRSYRHASRRASPRVAHASRRSSSRRAVASAPSSHSSGPSVSRASNSGPGAVGYH